MLVPNETENQLDLIHLDVGNPDNNFFELIMLPCIGRALDHGQSGIVLIRILEELEKPRAGTYKFIVLDVQQDEFGPKVGFLSSFDDLWLAIRFGPHDYSEEILTLGMLIRDTKSFKCSITVNGFSQVIRRQKGRKPTFLWPVFAVENRNLGEDTHLQGML